MSDLTQTNKRESDSSQSLLSKFQRYSWTFRKWWWVILITVSLGLSWAAWTDSKKPPSYISHGRMMVSGRVALPQGVTLSEEMQNFFGTQSRIMESVHVRQRAASSVESKYPELRASSVFLCVALEKGTSFFNLTAIGEEPNYTQSFLDACMEQYIKLKREWWSDIIAQKMVLLTDAQLKEEKELDSAFAELVDFQKRNDLSGLGEVGGNSAARRLAQMNERLASKKEEYQLLKVLDVEQNIERKKQSAIGSPNGDAEAEAGAAPSGAEVEYLKAKQELQLYKAEKLRRSKVMRPKHPLMIRLDAEITQQESVIQLFYDQSLAQLANKRESVRLEIETLESAVKDWGEKTLELAGRLAAYDKLKTKVEQSKAQQNNLQLSNNQVAVDARLQDDLIKVMDLASTAEATKPDFIKNLAIGALLGGLVGLVVVLVIGTLDDRVTSSIELRERFPEPLLGHIPFEIAAGDKRVSMLTVNNKQGIFVEAYRNLRSTLHFMSLEEPRPKAFLVTSAVPGEGKSTVAVNLGMIFAGGGSKTLLIDADLRKGLLHSYFDAEIAPGLIEILNGDAKWEDALVKTNTKNLTLIPRGKGVVGQSEFFMSNASDDFLRAVYAAGYDRIVIDSAPILATDDTACLAPKIDATLFVVRAEANRHAAARRCSQFRHGGRLRQGARRPVYAMVRHSGRRLHGRAQA